MLLAALSGAWAYFPEHPGLTLFIGIVLGMVLQNYLKK